MKTTVLFALVIVSTHKGDATTIYISPKGRDQPHCGNRAQKCKTIDHALNQTEGSTITMIFDTSSTQSLTYNLTKPFQRKRNGSTILHLRKDNETGLNPTIHGNNKPFLVEGNGDMQVHIDSFNLNQVKLVSMENSLTKINITIRNSSIFVYRSTFISLANHATEVFLSIRDCLFQSPFYIGEESEYFDRKNWKSMYIGDYKLLNVHRRLEKSLLKGRVEMFNTTITGGSIVIKNIPIFKTYQCQIKNNVPQIKNKHYVISRYTSYDAYGNGRFTYEKQPVPTSINVNKLSQTIPGVAIEPRYHILIKPNNCFRLENVKEFIIERCNVTRNIFKSFLFVVNSMGRITSFDLQKSLLRRLVYGKSSKIDISMINIEHVQAKAIEGSCTFLHMESTKLNMDRSRLSHSTIEQFQNSFTKSSVTIANIDFQDVEFKNNIFYLEDHGQLNASNIQLLSVRCRSNFINARNHRIYIKDLKIRNSTWQSEKPKRIINQMFLFYAAHGKIEGFEVSITNSNVSAAFRLERASSLVLTNMELNTTKVQETIFLVYSESHLKISNLRMINCTSESAFRIERKSKVTLTGVQTINCTTRKYFLCSRHSQVMMSDLKTRESTFYGFLYIVGEDKQPASLKTVDVQIVKTNIVNYGFFIRKGNTTIINLKMERAKVGSIVDSGNTILKMQNLSLIETQVVNVLFSSKASFSAFVFNDQCEVLMIGFYMLACSVDEALFLVDKSVIFLQDAHMENNSFTSGFKALASELHLERIHALGNKHLKFVTTKALSTIYMKGLSMFLNNLIYYESPIDALETELYVIDSEIDISQSFSLLFQVMRWKFVKESNLTNFTVTCPKNFHVILDKKIKEKSLKVFCQKCEKNTYPANGIKDQMQLTTSVHREGNQSFDGLQSNVLKCKDCPTGAKCTDGSIRARDNFHGLLNEQKEYSFLVCPDDYCCNAKSVICDSPTTCSNKRTGRLCGRCVKDHFVNLNNKCVHNSECSKRNKHMFWTFFFSVPITLAFILAFANDVKLLIIKWIVQIFCLRKKLTQRKRPVQPGRRVAANQSKNEGKNISLSATFNIIMTFYQLKALITVKPTASDESSRFVDHLFNIEWISQGRKEVEKLCSFHGVTVIHQKFLLGFVSPLVMVLTVVFCLLVCKCLTKTKKSVTGRFYIGFYIVLAFSYKNICHTAFSFINCKMMDRKMFLYIDGSIACFQPWQIANLVFLILWAFSFPIAVGIGYHKLKNRKISRSKFLLLLTFPFVSFFVVGCKKCIKTDSQHLHRKADRRLVEMFELPYKENYYWWEACRLMERFIIAGLSVLLTNPIYRILYITFVFAAFWYLHKRINPYKRTMFLLKRLDAVGWVCLLLLALLNEMRAIVYIYNIPNVDSITYALQAADILEQIISPLWYFIVSFIIRKFME